MSCRDRSGFRSRPVVLSIYRCEVAAVFAGVFAVSGSLTAAGCATRAQAPMLTPAPYAATQAAASDELRAGEPLSAARVDTIDGAVAIDMLAETTRSRVLPEPVYPCSAEANAAADAGRQHLDAGRRSAARAAYARALERCGSNAGWWIAAGDVELRDGNAEAARRMIRRGLELDLWNREGHRFLSYAEASLGNDEESWREAVLAVVSDPTCETCWALLKQVTTERGGSFNRQYERKPVAKAVEGRLDLELDPFEEISSSKGWVAYAINLGTRALRANLCELPAGKTRLRKDTLDVSWATWSPLERERFLVRTTLEQYDPAADRRSPGRSPKTWPVIKNAVEQGFLDEAIFMQLLDSALAPQFVAYRQRHAERLFDHVTAFLAVLPSGVGKRRSSQSAHGESLLPHMRRGVSS
jgi:tetratricopeptide (TPR) repeat protein